MVSSGQRTSARNTLSMADVYAIVSYYLASPAPMNASLATRDEKAEAMRQKLEAAGRTGRIGKERTAGPWSVVSGQWSSVRGQRRVGQLRGARKPPFEKSRLNRPQSEAQQRQH